MSSSPQPSAGSRNGQRSASTSSTSIPSPTNSSVSAALNRATWTTPLPSAEDRFGYVLCTSVNDAVLHGKPHGYRLRDGDLLSPDFAASVDGWVADAAISLVVGAGAPGHRADRLTERALDADRVARAGNRSAICHTPSGPWPGRLDWPSTPSSVDTASDDDARRPPRPQRRSSGSRLPPQAGPGHRGRAVVHARHRQATRRPRRMDAPQCGRKPHRPLRTHHRHHRVRADRPHPTPAVGPCPEANAGQAEAVASPWTCDSARAASPASPAARATSARNAHSRTRAHGDSPVLQQVDRAPALGERRSGVPVAKHSRALPQAAHAWHRGFRTRRADLPPTSRPGTSLPVPRSSSVCARWISATRARAGSGRRGPCRRRPAVPRGPRRSARSRAARGRSGRGPRSA